MTQKDIVTEIVKDGPKGIREIAEATGILEPNVRRILGMGAKEGTFERVEKGVYVLSKDGQDIAVIHTANAIKKLPELAANGFKADMVFLDPPYTTPAVKGGNRPQRFKIITPEEFGQLMKAVADIVRTDESPVYYICSRAPSGLSEMGKYTERIHEAGFNLVAEGSYKKLQADGVSPALNPQGRPTTPEAVMLYTKSGRFDEKELPRELDFTLIRPPVTGKGGRQTQKPGVMLKSLIMQGTSRGDTVLDPFAGTGVTAVEAIKAERRVVAVEIEEAVVRNFIIPRLQDSAGIFQLMS